MLYMYCCLVCFCTDDYTCIVAILRVLENFKTLTVNCITKDSSCLSTAQVHAVLRQTFLRMFFCELFILIAWQISLQNFHFNRRWLSQSHSTSPLRLSSSFRSTSSTGTETCTTPSQTHRSSAGHSTSAKTWARSNMSSPIRRAHSPRTTWCSAAARLAEQTTHTLLEVSGRWACTCIVHVVHYVSNCWISWWNDNRLRNLFSLLSLSLSLSLSFFLFVLFCFFVLYTLLCTCVFLQWLDG